MTDGVDDKLADDPDEGVKDVVWQISPWYIESDGELRSVQMLSHGLYYRFVCCRFVQCKVVKVPDAVAQLVSAGIERQQGKPEMPVQLFRRELARHHRRANAHRDSWEVLDDAVVQLDCEARTFGDLELAEPPGQFALGDFVAEPARSPVQRYVPGGYGDEQ